MTTSNCRHRRYRRRRPAAGLFQHRPPTERGALHLGRARLRDLPRAGARNHRRRSRQPPAVPAARLPAIGERGIRSGREIRRRFMFPSDPLRISSAAPSPRRFSSPVRASMRHSSPSQCEPRRHRSGAIWLGRHQNTSEDQAYSRAEAARPRRSAAGVGTVHGRRGWLVRLSAAQARYRSTCRKRPAITRSTIFVFDRKMVSACNSCSADAQ